MSRQVTCTLCGGPVDILDTVDMPNGPMCLDPCYMWLERMMDEDDPYDDDDDEFEVIVVFEPDIAEDDDDEGYDDDQW